jgi:hypothetical protein
MPNVKEDDCPKEKKARTDVEDEGGGEWFSTQLCWIQFYYTKGQREGDEGHAS